MKLEINSKTYRFIWGTRCLINVQKDLGHSAEVILASIANPEVLTSLIYNGLNLWCDNNGEERPFTDFADFIDKYDEIADADFYDHIVTDILESVYMGEPVVKYLEKKFAITITDFNKQQAAKKKYLATLEKSSSTSQAGDSGKVKSIRARSQNTKSKDTDKS